MSVDPTSDFALNVWLLMQRFRPRKIVETGTYLGTGTTAILASAIEDLLLDKEGAEFHSIEVNRFHHESAQRNLADSKMDHLVTLHHGLSVPRDLLPTAAQIHERTVTRVAELHANGIPVLAEHHPAERALRYYSETAEDVQDDVLGKVLARMDYRPDLVLLDSAGHMGTVEFDYVLDKIQGPCLFVLDDVFHVKHYDSFVYMEKSGLFDIRCVSREKYGFAIARYEPHAANAPIVPAD